MTKIINFYFLLSIVILLTNTIYTKTIKIEEYDEVEFLYKDKKWGKHKKNEPDTVTKGDDGYYMVFVNTTVSKNNLEKRDKNFNILNSVINEIQELILDNKDTYEDISKLEAIENDTIESLNDTIESLEKRETKYIDYGDSNLVYPISSVNGRTVLYAYLSEKLVGIVENIPEVTSCMPNYTFEYDAYYKLNEIKQEAQWDDVDIRYNTDLHLSLLSQGKFEEDLVHQYDPNYYFPKSGGKGINMIFLDSGFNFKSGDFANTHQRTVKCAYNVTNGKVLPVNNEKYCHATIPNDHGSRVSDCAAGYEHGIANKANIFGVVLNELNSANIIAAYQFVLDNLLVPHKTVINCSFGEEFQKDMYNEAMIHSEELINKINDDGGVMVVSAGNSGYNVNDDVNNRIYYPCAFKNTLCVGGIDNYDLESVNYDLGNYSRTNTISSSSIYKRFRDSNYGKEVSVYAPFFVRVAFLDSQDYYMDGIDGGTSYSSPIVAGIAATIMSENPDIKFNTYLMTKYITRLSEKNIIKNIDEGFPNAFVNNGKHVVYSDDNLYNGCGTRAGNQKCPHNKCCSADNKCTDDKNLCRSDKGCQVVSSLDTCKYIQSPVEGRCGNGFGSCPFGYCCSSEGVCGKSANFCGAGCQINYGSCY